MTRINRNKLDELTERIIGIGIEIHNKLGPGFVEKIYEKAMAYEFGKNRIKFKEQAEIGVTYKTIELGYQRVDFVVEEKVIAELKCVSELSDIHLAQVLSYLKTTDMKVGLILNFAERRLKVKRIVNNY